jgi:hypothetical protein
VTYNTKGSPDRERRRGSVLVLVMTLLGVLFVTGIVFLASMNFEAEMIAARQQRDLNEHGVRAVVDEFGSILRDGLMAGPNRPFSGAVVGESKGGFAELPGVHNLFAPIEPHQPLDDYGGFSGRFVFPWITDVFSLTSGSHDGLNFRELGDYQVNGNPIVGIDMTWQSGVRLALGGGPSDTAYPVDLLGETIIVPVDADGDGIVDTIQFPFSALGFSDAQTAAVSSQLNPQSNPTGEVYLGLRIIAHGGLVNLNESHPNLIANVLDLDYVSDLTSLGNDPAIGYFRHRPTSQQVPYSPVLEEPILRRRGLLPPRFIPPSWLHGNPFLDPDEHPFGQADMWQQLFPPSLPGTNLSRVYQGYETVHPDGHTYTPFAPLSMDPDLMFPVWAVRMEPFVTNGTGYQPGYDRRHLVTTISHDDLLSRGGRWEELDSDWNRVEHDLLEKMRQANRAADTLGPCPFLPFEYADYPHDILNNTAPDPEFPGEECTGPTQAVCSFDPRKGRLQLSLPWLDEEVQTSNFTEDQAQGVIHDVFSMMVSNAHGEYWEDTTCFAATCGFGKTCKGVCAGGDHPGRKCTVDTDCAGGECVLAVCLGGPNQGNPCIGNPNCPGGECRLGACVDDRTEQSDREALISRTAASLTANMIDYMDYDGNCAGSVCSPDLDIPTRVPLRSFDFSDPESAGRPVMLVCADDPKTSCTKDADCTLGCRRARVCVGGSSDRTWCATDVDCPGGSCRRQERTCHGGGRDGLICTSDEYCDPGVCTPKPHYVYGLERQPFITEVATAVNTDTGKLEGWAVELFNPYGAALEWDADGDAQPDYWLVEVGPTVSGGPTPINRIPIKHTLPAKQFTVFRTDPNNGLGLGIPPPTGVHDAANALTFTSDARVYLVRRITYPGDVKPTEIVLDQVWLDPSLALNIGVNEPPRWAALNTDNVYSMQRPAPQASPWKAVVGLLRLPDASGHLLGVWNGDDPRVREVEVNFANTGSFTLPHYNGSDPGIAFPTTGSLLLLMRHANRSLDEYAVDTGNHLAFTTWLGLVNHPLTGQPLPAPEFSQIDNGRMPVFNPPPWACEGGTNDGNPCDPNVDCPGGTCSVATGLCTGGIYQTMATPPTCKVNRQCPGVAATCHAVAAAHHVHPAKGACCAPSGILGYPDTCTEVFLGECIAAGGEFLIGAECSADMCEAGRDAPGGLSNLPWGQLVFDYFTALPLSAPGPYGVPGFYPSPGSTPRVDLNGLRVHGRININTAPWKVLAGLPLMDPQRFPEHYRGKIAEFTRVKIEDFAAFANYQCVGGPNSGNVCLDHADCQPPGFCTAKKIGDQRAQAIVAYREQRAVTVATSDYDLELRGRGWNAGNPLFRRGTGFLTVGELANVRHAEALEEVCPAGVTPPCQEQPILGFDRYSYSRMDAGMIRHDAADEDYVKAIALLVSLGDWVTVRSQVFTVYGVLRGEEDDEIEHAVLLTQDRLQAADVDSRAVRFQETVDRLPTFLGQPVPVLVGERVIRKYTDVHDD